MDFKYFLIILENNFYLNSFRIINFFRFVISLLTHFLEAQNLAICIVYDISSIACIANFWFLTSSDSIILTRKNYKINEILIFLVKSHKKLKIPFNFYRAFFKFSACPEENVFFSNSTSSLKTY